MEVYAIATTKPVHAPCCEVKYRNKFMERYRVHICGMYLNLENARKIALDYNRRGYATKYYVVKYKVRDCVDSSGIIEIIDGDI